MWRAGQSPEEALPERFRTRTGAWHFAGTGGHILSFSQAETVAFKSWDEHFLKWVQYVHTHTLTQAGPVLPRHRVTRRHALSDAGYWLQPASLLGDRGFQAKFSLVPGKPVVPGVLLGE